MSDRDFILQFLEKAEKRVRSNKRFHEITTALAIAFMAPVVFKLLDLWVLFRARTVAAFFTLWLVGTLTWIVMRLPGRKSLGQSAATIDRKANLQDQLKTAYWFICNPRESEWVDAHLRRTATETSRVRLDSLYPWKFPRTSLIAATLLFVLIALNFVPLSLNHNWAYLQAAPPFPLNEAERTNLERALNLLEKAKSTENAGFARKIEALFQDFQRGDISLNDAIRQLDILRNGLEASERDTARMASDLSQRMSDHALRAEAGDALSNLLADLQSRDATGSAGGVTSIKTGLQGKAGERTGGAAETGERGQKSAGEGQLSGGNGDEGQQPGEGDPRDQIAKEAKQSSGVFDENAPNGQGGNSFRSLGKSDPLEGEATSLEVQLQKESLPFQAGGGGKEPSKDSEAAGERERSKLDYRNAPSDLTPSQKDLLSQARIPWENRQFVKDYFQAIKPKSK